MGYIGLIRNIQLSIGEVSLGSEAERMGLRRGDVIERIDDMKIASYIQGIEKIAASQGKELTIYILRGAERLVLKGVPQPSEDMYDGKIRGKLGFAPVIPVRIKKFGFVEGLDASIKENIRFTRLFFVSISKLITGKLSLRSMSGLPEITKISIDVAKQGAVPFIFLMGFISLNLALFNLLPIPLLDGGSILIIILEGIRRKDFSLATKERILQVGFLIIIALVIVILYNDAVKLFFS